MRFACCLRVVVVPAAMGLFCFCTSCATIVNGTHQKVSVVTVPPGASATVGLVTITTPGEFSLSRNRDHMMEISMPGYDSRKVYLNRDANWSALGDILLLPLFLPALVVDTYSGGMWTLHPAAVSVQLEPTSSGVSDLSAHGNGSNAFATHRAAQ